MFYILSSTNSLIPWKISHTDALVPAVEAMEKTAGEGLLAMLKAAEEAARQGVEDTKRYQAKFGRAKSLLERAIGYQDAGATSVWLIFQPLLSLSPELL